MAYTAIDNPELYFQAKIYTGNGSTQSITLDGDTDMSPNLVWFSGRSNADDKPFFDTVRGTGEAIYSDLTNAEVSSATTLTAFDSDGFSIGNNGVVNTNTYTYVAWCWKATGSTAANSNGTNITSTVDANTTAGFSIVSYDGTNTTSDTVGHGLSSLDFLIVKTRDETDSWCVKHKDLASGKDLRLDQTVAETDVVNDYSEGGLANLSGNTFGFLAGTDGNAYACNEASNEHIAYCFKGVQAFSKFGSYATNNNADGPYIFTGFSPAFVMLKVASGNTGGWDIYDNKRGFNPNEEVLQANASTAEASSDAIDLLSNGFKIRNTSGNQNGSGDTIIYMAFAEAPFVNSNGVPCNAR